MQPTQIENHKPTVRRCSPPAVHKLDPKPAGSHSIAANKKEVETYILNSMVNGYVTNMAANHIFYRMPNPASATPTGTISTAPLSSVIHIAPHISQASPFIEASTQALCLLGRTLGLKLPQYPANTPRSTTIDPMPPKRTQTSAHCADIPDHSGAPSTGMTTITALTSR